MSEEELEELQAIADNVIEENDWLRGEVYDLEKENEKLKERIKKLEEQVNFKN